MNQTNDASDFVLFSAFLIAGSTIVRLVRQNKWQGNVAKVIVFGFLLTLFLLIIESFNPTIAKILSGLGLVGAFVINGPAVVSAVPKPAGGTIGPSEPNVIIKNQGRTV